MNERLSRTHTCTSKASPAVMGMGNRYQIPQTLTHGLGTGEGGGLKRLRVMCVYVCVTCADANECKMISIVHTGIPMTVGSSTIDPMCDRSTLEQSAHPSALPCIDKRI